MSKYETLAQATMLGRVGRLTGISIQSNPFSKNSDLWIAFSEGWNRSLDDPLIGSLRKSKQKPAME